MHFTLSKKVLVLFLSISIIFFAPRTKALAGCVTFAESGDICGEILADPVAVPGSNDFFDVNVRITMETPNTDFRYLDAVHLWFTKNQADGNIFGWTTPLSCEKILPSGSSAFSVSDTDLMATDISITGRERIVTFRCNGSPYSHYGTPSYIRLAVCNTTGMSPSCGTSLAPVGTPAKAVDHRPYDFSIHGSLQEDGQVAFKSCGVNTSTGKADVKLDIGTVTGSDKFYLRLSKSETGGREAYSGPCTDVNLSGPNPFSCNWISGCTIGIHGNVNHNFSCGIASLTDLQQYYFQIVKNNVDNGIVEAYCPVTKFEAKLSLPNKGYQANSSNNKIVPINLTVQTLPADHFAHPTYIIKAETLAGVAIKSCVSQPITSPGNHSVMCDFNGVPGGPAGSEKRWALRLYTGAGRALSVADPKSDLTGMITVQETSPNEIGSNGSCVCILSAAMVCGTEGGPLAPGVSGIIRLNNCFPGTTPTARCKWIGGTSSNACKCACTGTPSININDQAPDPSTGLVAPQFHLDDFASWMGNIHNYLIALGVIISVFMLPYAFVLMGTGDPSNIKKGQEMLQSLAIGLAVLILSGTIIRIIASEVIGL